MVGLVIAPSSQWAAWQVSGPEGVNSRPRYAAYSISKPICLRAIAGSIPPTTAIPTATEHDQDHNDEDKKRGGIHLGLLLGVFISPRGKPRRLGKSGASSYRSLDRLASGSLGREKPIRL